MRDDICTIPVSEVFEVNDGCPICRMRDTVEKHIVDYIMGAAMMEPDVRIETNKRGFCEHHLNQMMDCRGRLQLALMLQTHIDEINNKVLGGGFLTSDTKRGEKAKTVSESCFICDKIEFGLSRMIETIYRCYENERDFRDMFNGQSAFCLPHYERLMAGASKKNMRSKSGEFSKNLTRITNDYSKKLYDQLTDYCKIYDYRSKKQDADNMEAKQAVERTVAFLNGRYF